MPPNDYRLNAPPELQGPHAGDQQAQGEQGLRTESATLVVAALPNQRPQLASVSARHLDTRALFRHPIAHPSRQTVFTTTVLF
jgi:hypothetical protein